MTWIQEYLHSQAIQRVPDRLPIVGKKNNASFINIACWAVADTSVHNPNSWGRRPLPCTAGCRPGVTAAYRLYGRTGDRTVRTEDAAVAGLRLELSSAASTYVEELAGVRRHRFRLNGYAVRTGDLGFEDHRALRFSSRPSLSAQINIYS